MIERQDRIELDERFPFRIYEVTLRSEDNANDSFHWHDYFEITLVLEGAGCYYAGGHSFDVGAGDIVIFNNSELHGWQVVQSEMKVLVLIFSGALVAGYSSFSETEYLGPFIERGSGFKNKVGAEEPCAAEIASIMSDIRGEWRQKNMGYALMIRANVLRILTMLVRHYSDSDRDADLPAQKSRALKRMQRALDYIHDHYCEKITLQDAARTIYMSPNYFSHYFHSATGVCFSDYVTLLRIRRARALLENTGKSIYEIALECGFPNSSNFYRLYRKHTGTSPRSGRQRD